MTKKYIIAIKTDTRTEYYQGAGQKATGKISEAFIFDSYPDTEQVLNALDKEPKLPFHFIAQIQKVFPF